MATNYCFSNKMNSKFWEELNREEPLASSAINPFVSRLRRVLGMTKAKQTRFPVVRGCLILLELLVLMVPGGQARIKKIMQKDEEVGKVAQATPMLTCSSTFLSILPYVC